MELKILGIKEIKEIIDFDKECFPVDFWKDSDWKELLEDSNAIYYSFVDEGRIVADTFIYNWEGKKDYVKIMNVAVKEEYRNKGLGEKLLTKVREDMLKHGMKKFCGETRSTNKAMQSLFTKCGYRLTKKEANYFTNPIEEAYKYVLEIE